MGGGIKKKIDAGKLSPDTYSVVGKAPNGAEVRFKGSSKQIFNFFKSLDSEILESHKRESAFLEQLLEPITSRFKKTKK